jgi:hypothetical protein
MSMIPTMHEYYSKQQVLPTHAGFQTPAELQRYEALRRNIFIHKLGLLPRVFHDARLLEFGPDSGENSLVFASWGARCTLSEPNPRAHPFIVDYFRRFNLTSQLVDLRSASVGSFGQQYPDEHYDIIDAEGFIYTVRPERPWMDLFARLLEPNGLVMMTYMEAYGSYLELMLKVIHRRLCSLTGAPSLECAQRVFAEKWDSIPHTRSFASWVMDVLENPFVRLQYFFEPQSLCQEMYDAGFVLYSSWPSYRDGLCTDWAKKPWKAEEALRSQAQFVAQSRLSHLFGRKCFLAQPDPDLDKSLWELLTLTDGLIDEFSPESSARCRQHLDRLSAVVGSDAVILSAPERASFRDCLEATANILRLLERGAADDVVAFCKTNPTFITYWGSPAHWAIFCRSANTTQ